MRPGHRCSNFQEEYQSGVQPSKHLTRTLPRTMATNSAGQCTSCSEGLRNLKCNRRPGWNSFKGIATSSSCFVSIHPIGSLLISDHHVLTLNTLKNVCRLLVQSLGYLQRIIRMAIRFNRPHAMTTFTVVSEMTHGAIKRIQLHVIVP